MHSTVLFGLALAAVTPASLVAQDPTTVGAIAFQQACLDATSDAVVLNIAAHPDDESARSMVVFRHGFGLRTVTLYSTCGEGGQNAIGREIGPQLASIRIRETLQAARLTGTEVRWLGFPDFGFSKSMEETFGVWGKPALLQRMQAVVDDVAPDFVVTNHSVGQGHGHHRASAFAIEAACRTRGEQLGRPVPLFQRFIVDKEKKLKPSFELDAKIVDPVRGATYARQAYQSILEHASQGPWGIHNPTRVTVERWRRVVPPLPEPAEGEEDPVQEQLPWLEARSMFDSALIGEVAAGVGVELDSLRADLAAFGTDRSRTQHIAEARRLLPMLRSLAAALSGEAEARDPLRRLARRIEALERVVVIGAGIHLEVQLGRATVPVGGSTKVDLALRGPEVEDLSIRCGDFVAVPKTKDEDEGWFEAEIDTAAAGVDDSVDPVVSVARLYRVPVVARFSVDGLAVSLSRLVDVSLGATLDVAWARDTAFVPGAADQANWKRVYPLEIRYLGTQPLREPVRVRHPEGLQVTAVPAVVELSRERPRVRVLIKVESKDATPSTGSRSLSVVVGSAPRVEMQLVPIPAAPAAADAAEPQPRIGLIRGPDDTVQTFLEDVGLAFDILDDARLAVADLSDWTTIVLDMRVYHHRPDLGNYREQLLRFCRSGGRVLALYHKTGEWNPRAGKPSLAPFELKVGRARVAEEDASIKVLETDHRLWSQPYRIGAADFDAWVQERGLYFGVSWDPAWVPLTEMNDAGEELRRGALLYARYGRGDYVYCALSLYRQLRAGKVGAARLFINLLTPLPR